MTNEYDQYIYEEGYLPRQWRSPLTWSGLLLIGWVIYELTMQPALASAAVCIKFGWEDFRTAFWLRRKDPSRPRGRACRALYLSSGLWKTAIAATILFFVLAVVTSKPAPQRAAGNPPPPPGHIIVPFLTAFFGYALLTLATLRALWLALWYRVRLWLDPAVHRARKQDFWPPTEFCAGNQNQANRVLLTSLVMILFPLLLVLIVVGVNLAGNAANRAPQGSAFAIAMIMGPSVGLPIGLLLLKDLLHRRVVARTPEECWDDAGLPERELWQQYGYETGAADPYA